MGRGFRRGLHKYQVLKGFELMALGLEESGEKDIHMRVVFGFWRVSGLERGQGDLLLIFVEGISVHPAIMGDTPIK